ncbi:MAG: hypothetical protein AABZ67_00525 [Pseudomonadota bacterium]
MVGVAAAAIPAVISGANMLFGDSGEQSPNPPPVWTPGAGMQQQDFNQYRGLMDQYYNAAGAYPVQNYPAQNYGQFQQQVGDLTGDPFGYAALARQGAVQGSQIAPQVAGYQMGGAGALYGLGQGAAPMANQIAQTAFDPQSALYGRTQQQVQDQTAAWMANQGIAQTPYGAGVMGKTLSDFNIDWQNQQLNRQISGAYGYGGLTGTAGNAFDRAGGLGQGAMNTYASGAAAPYNTYAGQIQNNLSGLSALNQAGQQTWALPQQAFGNYGQYTGQGQAQNYLGQNAAQQQFGNLQAMGQGFGQSLAGLSGAFGDSNFDWNSLFGMPSSFGFS